MEATPELLEQIRALVESGQIGSLVDPRLMPSRQLDDLRNGPFDPKNPKPSFFIHDVPPDLLRNNMQTFPYPRLLWAPNGVEVTVKDLKAHRQLVAEGYSEVAPNLAPETAEDKAKREFDLLSAEDQAFVLEQVESHRKDRLAALAQHLNVEPKRGPGRPKKVAV